MEGFSGPQASKGETEPLICCILNIYTYLILLLPRPLRPVAYIDCIHRRIKSSVSVVCAPFQ